MAPPSPEVQLVPELPADPDTPELPLAPEEPEVPLPNVTITCPEVEPARVTTT